VNTLLFLRRRGSSALGKIFTNMWQNSPLAANFIPGSKFAPRGEIKNWPQIIEHVLFQKSICDWKIRQKNKQTFKHSSVRVLLNWLFWGQKLRPNWNRQNVVQKQTTETKKKEKELHKFSFWKRELEFVITKTKTLHIHNSLVYLHMYLRLRSGTQAIR
jgi:hypothetical protein